MFDTEIAPFLHHAAADKIERTVAQGNVLPFTRTIGTKWLFHIEFIQVFLGRLSRLIAG